MARIIATLDAWKLFVLLTISAILMILLMPYGGLGFIVMGLSLFTWLFCITHELAKTNSIDTSNYIFASVAGGSSSILFVLAGHLLEKLQLAVGAIIALVFLSCLVYLMVSVGLLLAKAEKTLPAKINVGLLVYLWPVEVWYLQPRLQNVLRK
jgi:predicted membrane channel-forming protein YqfA (hemolysin III family)